MNALHQALRHLHQKPIAYYPAYAQLMGSIVGGVVLSQLMYWAARTDGEFYKTDEELRRETGCSVDELKAVKRRLKQLPFLAVEVRGLPPRTYYRVDWDALVLALGALRVRTEEPDADPEPVTDDAETPPINWGEFHQTIGGNSTNCLAEIPPNIYNKDSESTTESTYRESRSDADASNAKIATTSSPPKRPRSLRLRVEVPRTKEDKPDYFREVRAAFREVLGDDSDTLAIRACLAGWKQVREGGMSAEQLTQLWKRARENASEDKRQYVTLVWVLNHGDKARWLAEHGPIMSRSSGAIPHIVRQDIADAVVESLKRRGLA